MDAARAKAGRDVVVVEVFHAVDPLQAHLVAGTSVEGRLLEGFDLGILLRIAQLAVEVRVELRLLQLLADLEHRPRHRRHGPGMRAVEAFRDIADVLHRRSHDEAVRVRSGEDLQITRNARGGDRERSRGVHRLVRQDGLAATDGLDVPIDDLARVRQIGCGLRLCGRLRVQGRQQQRRHHGDS